MLARERRKLILPFLLPGLILYLVFFIYPTVQGLYMSFFNWSGFNQPATFVGATNFVNLAGDDSFHAALSNTIFLLVVGGIFIFGFAFLFTAILSSGIRGKRFFRAILFFPNVVAPIALTTLWGFIYNPRFGLINSFLGAIGLSQLQQTWTDPSKLFGALTVALVWIYTGYYVILLMAGADKIPPDIYDAAKVDGASTLQMFFFVTIPMMWDVLAVSAVLWMITALKQFEFVYAFSGLQVRLESMTMPIYLFIMGFGKRDPIYRLGYASAIGFVLLALVVIFALVLGRLFRRERIEY